MIERVQFENFKSLKKVAIDLGRLTVLVGPNGCGKSSVLQGMHLLSRTGISLPDERRHVFSRFHQVFQGWQAPDRLASPGRPTAMILGMRSSGGDELKLKLFVQQPTGDNAYNELQGVEVSLNGPADSSSITLPIKDATQRPGLELLDDPRVKQFSSAVYLHLDANKMVPASVSQDVRPRMGADGAQLASALAWMKGAAEDELAEITRDLGRIVPGVKRIRTLRERTSLRRVEQIDVEGQPVWRPVTETVVSDRFEVEFQNGQAIRSELLSEGTVLALGLLTVVHEPQRPRLILLDDIDRGLHIEAQARLVEVLRDLMMLDPELQVVCTTHSPYLLDRFEPSEVRVLALDSNRHTKASTLSNHPEFEKWKFGTQTGELWAALGDAWVAASAEQTQ